MSTSRMRSPFGRRSILVVAFIVVLGAAGLVWAHWFTSLRVDANINTGNVGIGWQGTWTNDDGVDNGDGEDGSWPEMWDMWGDSSADPASFDGDRYDKDVARCWIDGGEGSDHIAINIENGYPSYHCRAYAEIMNWGSVPIKALPSEFSMVRGWYQCDWYHFDTATGEWLNPIYNIEGDEGGPYLENGEPGSGFDPGFDQRIYWYDDGEMHFYWVDENANDMYDGGEMTLIDDCYVVGEELAMEPMDGGFGWGYYNEEDEFVAEITGFLPGLFECSHQIDPGDGGFAEFGFHVEQPAQQNTQYILQMHQGFVNWNQFEPAWCE